jgi:hypothetical protein
MQINTIFVNKSYVPMSSAMLYFNRHRTIERNSKRRAGWQWVTSELNLIPTF